MPAVAKHNKEHLAVALERVEQNGQRMPIRKRGRIVAALVPADDYRLLEEMDRQDVKAARTAMTRAKARGEKPIPWAEVKRQLKL